jgi:hypothetical protein
VCSIRVITQTHRGKRKQGSTRARDTRSVMTRIFYPYPLILFLFSSPHLCALIANPFLILIPSRVLPTVGRFALFGPSLPLPFVSALFVFTCALEGQPPLLTASAAPSHWLRDACAMLLCTRCTHTLTLCLHVRSRRVGLRPSFRSSHKEGRGREGKGRAEAGRRAGALRDCRPGYPRIPKE